MAMAAPKRGSSSAAWFLLVLGFFTAMVSSSEAYVFYAGGRDGWVVDPAESYNHWAERNRFQVNDTIVFTYDEGADSVLLVTETDFDACSTRNPVRRLDSGGGGRSVFRFDRSGPFFFVSGDEDRCQKGHKLYIIVMAVRPTKQPLAPAPGSSQICWPRHLIMPAFPPASATAPPQPQWASAPEYAQAPGVSALGPSGDVVRASSGLLGAPPPTSGAAGLDGVIVGAVVAFLGALVL